jgi:hypothetical protein
MTRYARVMQILDEAIGGPDANIGSHGAFWRGLPRSQFVTKQVFNMDLMAVGSGAAAHLVKALTGEAPFGAELPNPPPGAQSSKMSVGAPPASDTDIACIQTWIEDGCPADPLPPLHEVWFRRPACIQTQVSRRKNQKSLLRHLAPPWALRRGASQRPP